MVQRIPRRNLLIFGGIISSTNVTLSFARMSPADDAGKIPLAYDVIGASAVVFVRVGIATAVLNPATAQAVVPYMAVPSPCRVHRGLGDLEISRTALGRRAGCESFATLYGRSDGVVISASFVRRTRGSEHVGASRNLCIRRCSRIR